MISVNMPVLGSKELEYVTECVRTGWISSAGRFIEEFENGWASYCGMRHGIAVSSGTTALEVALGCLDLQPGDEVIIPSFTIVSCALAVLYNNGVPVLVDSDPSTWCMDPDQVEARITPKTKAIMPVHIYGHPVDMDPIKHIAQKYNITIIEDAAEAHGAEYKSSKCGSLGDINCFSFYANKVITTGEGGMLLTDSDDYAERARSLRNLCFLPERRFYHQEMGHNFRITNLQAALGLAQIERIDQLVEHKRWIGQMYNKALSGLAQLILPVEKPWAKNIYWMYGIVLKEESGLNATVLAKNLLNNGVETRPFFLGMHEQPVFLKQGLFIDEHYPVAERLARQGLYLPSGLNLTEDQMSTVCEAINACLA